MSVLTILDDGTAEKRSADDLRYQVDFDGVLAVGVELATAGTVTADPSDGQITVGTPSLDTGNRAVLVSLSGGRTQKTYSIKALVTTNESPTQTFDKRFHLFIKP